MCKPITPVPRLEVMSSIPGQVKLGVLCTSILSCTRIKILLCRYHKEQGRIQSTCIYMDDLYPLLLTVQTLSKK